jgi:hypothetical protein
MTDVIAELRQALAGYDRVGPAEPGSITDRMAEAVRRLIAEVDGQGAAYLPPMVDPLGGPMPGVAGSHLPGDES